MCIFFLRYRYFFWLQVNLVVLTRFDLLVNHRQKNEYFFVLKKLKIFENIYTIPSVLETFGIVTRNML